MMRRLAPLAMVALLAGTGCKKLTDWTADHHARNVNVWVYGPSTVAPGDTLPLEVSTRSGYRSGISVVRLFVGDKQETIEGRGAHWGYSISSKGSSEDEQDVELKIPADAKPGPLPVSIVVEYVSAQAAGNRTYENVADADEIDFTLEVGTSGNRTFARALLVARGVGALAVVAALLYVVSLRLGRRKVARDAGGGSNVDMNLAAAAFLLAMVGIGYLGYWAFALPTVRGLMTSSALLRYVLVALWFAIPVLALVRGFRRGRATRALVKGFQARLRAVLGRPESQHRTAPTGDALDQRAAPAVSLARLRTTLEREGLTIKQRRRSLDISTKDGPVTLSTDHPDQSTPEMLTLSAGNRAALEAIARLLIPDLGPILLTINGHAALLD
jgi:hypothetical protein